MDIRQIKIDDIEVSSHRKRKHGDISGLVESIKAIGLMNPITVVIHEKSGGGLETKSVPVLVAGLNRMEAFKAMGETEIPARVLKLYDLDVELAEIDENLIRNELTKLERAEHLKRRQEIYEAKGGLKVATPGGAQDSGYARLAMAATGLGKSTINQEIKIAKSIAPDVKETISGTAIADASLDLRALAKADPKDQRIAVERVLEGKAKTVREALPKKRGDGPSERLKAAMRAYTRLTEKEKQEFRAWME